VIQFGRSIVLARILDVDAFGIYSFASSWVVATRSISQFGLGGALVHRARESEGEPALRVHFTLSLMFSIVWAIGLAALGPVLVPQGMPRVGLWVLWTLIAAEFIDQLTYTPRTKLVRGIVFRRIAVMNLATTLLATALTVAMALSGWGVWSLVASDVVGASVLIVGLYVWRPVWRPRLGWSHDVARYFLDFGRRSFLASLLLQALDRVDDLWTGFFQGEIALGFYSRAYRFATYPRTILANPINAVTTGTYAELADRRHPLSQAFFRINALLIRTGFLMAGLLALVAPEFIRIVLGARWLPMLTAFRLMLIFTLLDPIKQTLASLFTAVGCPEKVVRTRAIQLIVLVVGLFGLGRRWGIAGVALAVDIMLLVGIGLLLWQAKSHVDFSTRRMFSAPTLALALGMIFGRASIAVPGVLGSAWRSGTVKSAAFLVTYSGVIAVIEREHVAMLLAVSKQLLTPTARQSVDQIT
jgi:PST family polysaccharide transporter